MRTNISASQASFPGVPGQQEISCFLYSSAIFKQAQTSLSLNNEIIVRLRPYWSNDCEILWPIFRSNHTVLCFVVCTVNNMKIIAITRKISRIYSPDGGGVCLSRRQLYIISQFGGVVLCVCSFERVFSIQKKVSWVSQVGWGSREFVGGHYRENNLFFCCALTAD